MTNNASIFRARPVLLAVSIALGAALCAPAPVLALGGDQPSQPPKSCPKGKVWSSGAGRCVPAHSGAVPDDELVEHGRQLAVTGSYDKAIEVLELVTRKNDPLVLTYLGFSHRKLGNVEQGMKLYGEALALDPDSVVTREYLGEGYVATGEIDRARHELAEIEARCGTGCEAYHDLAEAIAQAKTE